LAIAFEDFEDGLAERRMVLVGLVVWAVIVTNVVVDGEAEVVAVPLSGAFDVVHDEDSSDTGEARAGHVILRSDAAASGEDTAGTERITSGLVEVLIITGDERWEAGHA
jgi:hypothetical protein